MGVGRRDNEPYHIKTLIVTETRRVDNKTTLTGCVAAGAVMTLLGQSQQDTRVMRGADVYSDHYLVKTRIRLKVSGAEGRKNVRERF